MATVTFKPFSVFPECLPPGFSLVGMWFAEAHASGMGGGHDVYWTGRFWRCRDCGFYTVLWLDYMWEEPCKRKGTG